MKIWLIQNIIAPYRVELFRRIAQTEGIEFKLIVLAKRLRSAPQWDFSLETMPFEAERVPGWCFYTGYEEQICINPALLLKMLREKPDVVVCAGFSFASLLTLVYRLITGHHYVVWNEGTFYTESRHSFFRKFLRRIISRSAGIFISAGSVSKRYLESLLPESFQKAFFISYNCIDNHAFSMACERVKGDSEFKDFRKRFPDKNILYAGQLIDRKGVMQLLQVYAQTAVKYPDPVGLIFVGQGPLKNHIENEKTNHKWKHVFLEGFIPHGELPKYYAIADVFMLLSLYDPNPLVVFEALACGLPIICSERAGNAIDFIVDGKNGYIVDPTDICDIVQKTTDLLQTARREEIASFSRSIVQKANYDDSAKAFVDACCYAFSKKK